MLLYNVFIISKFYLCARDINQEYHTFTFVYFFFSRKIVKYLFEIICSYTIQILEKGRDVLEIYDKNMFEDGFFLFANWKEIQKKTK